MATDYIRLLPTHHLMSNTSNLVNRLNLRKAQPQATRHVAFWPTRDAQYRRHGQSRTAVHARKHDTRRRGAADLVVRFGTPPYMCQSAMVQTGTQSANEKGPLDHFKVLLGGRVTRRNRTESEHRPGRDPGGGRGQSDLSPHGHGLHSTATHPPPYEQHIEPCEPLKPTESSTLIRVWGCCNNELRG